MRASHVIIETRPALVGSITLVTLEPRGIPRAPLIVVLHSSNTATLGLTPLHGHCNVYTDALTAFNIHWYCYSAEHAINDCTMFI